MEIVMDKTIKQTSNPYPCTSLYNKEYAISHTPDLVWPTRYESSSIYVWMILQLFGGNMAWDICCYIYNKLQMPF